MSNKERAADYVMGVLTDAERAAVERDAAADPALATEIARINADLATLLGVVEGADAQPTEQARSTVAQLLHSLAAGGGGAPMHGADEP